MARMVNCRKLGKELPGLDFVPFDDALGERLYREVSAQGWQTWLEHSKMLINEYRLDLVSESGQRIWFTELEKYFWGEGSKVPDQFKPVGEGEEPPAGEEKK